MSYRIESGRSDIEEELYFLEKSCSDVFEVTHKAINEQLSGDQDLDPKLRDLLFDFASIKQNVQNLKQAAVLTNKKLCEGDIDFATISEDIIDTICDDHLTETTKNSVQENREMQIVQDVDKHIANRNQTDNIPPTESQELFSLNESDVVMTENVETFTDPLSKVPIKNPLKNKYCGHYFEKSSVLEYVGNQYKKCPYIGCNKYMSAKDLIEDTELMMKIAKSHEK